MRRTSLHAPRLRMAKASARVPEKVEQANIVQAARSVGAFVVVLGTVRRGSRCKCGEWVQGHMGTQQTPGVADLEIFLPLRAGLVKTRELVKWETKAQGGRLSQDQIIYREECAAAGVTHGVGDFDAFLALLVTRGLVKAENVPHYRREEVQP